MYRASQFFPLSTASLQRTLQSFNVIQYTFRCIVADSTGFFIATNSLIVATPTPKSTSKIVLTTESTRPVTLQELTSTSTPAWTSQSETTGTAPDLSTKTTESPLSGKTRALTHETTHQQASPSESLLDSTRKLELPKLQLTEQTTSTTPIWVTTTTTATITPSAMD